MITIPKPSLIPAAGLLLQLAACASSQQWNATDVIPLEEFVVQSHRGAGFLAEENTLHAFKLAWDLGTYPESDVRTTKDGVIVAFHDASFNRVARNLPEELADKGVHDVTFEELSKLDVGRWDGNSFVSHSVPRLSEVFAEMKKDRSRHLYLDIKDVDLAQLSKEVLQAEVGAQVVLAAPKPETIREWKSLVPDSETLLWMGGSEAQLRERVAALRETDFEGITQVQIHIRLPKSDADKVAAGPNPFTLSDAFIVELGKELRKREILYQALPYTSDSTVYERLLDLGLASFATDHPKTTLQEIRRYYEQRRH